MVVTWWIVAFVPSAMQCFYLPPFVSGDLTLEIASSISSTALSFPILRAWETDGTKACNT